MALHKPLETDDSIRLLRVHRNQHGHIEGELKGFALRSKHVPTYKAISYVWGDRTGKKDITVNGFSVEVLKSVHGVLEAICDTPQLFFLRHESGASAWIWLDSICINQDNVVELGQQVELMGEIFGRARSVIVWLGPGTAQTDRGMELMRLLAMCGENERIAHPMLKDVEAWRGYQVIASNPWWKRAWTLQESLVPQEVVYHCGAKSLAEKQVSRATLVTDKLMPNDPSLDENSWAPMWNRRRITQWYWKGEDPGQYIGLPALLAYTSHAQASNEADYIFALVGCVNTLDQSIVGRPNYSLNVETIYTAFARKWILRHQSLDIICFTTLFKPETSDVDTWLPSWVPNWRNRPSFGFSASNPVPLLVSQPANKHIGSFVPRKFLSDDGYSLPFRASGKEKAFFHFSDDLERLTVKGIILDRLDGLGGMIESPEESSIDVREPLVQSTSSVNCPTAYLETGIIPEGESMAVANDIALGLVLGRADVYLQHTADASRVVAQIMTILADARNGRKNSHRRTREILGWLRYNGPLLIRGVALGQAFTSHPAERIPELRETDFGSDTGDEHYIKWKYKKVAAVRDMARRVAVTENGHVGMVPQNAQKGDLVCVLYGCSVPVVLRQVESGQYHFVGECFLQGFMEGQAVEEGSHNLQKCVLV